MLIKYIVYIISGFKIIQVRLIFALAFHISYVQTLRVQSESMVNHMCINFVQLILLGNSANRNNLFYMKVLSVIKLNMYYIYVHFYYIQYISNST